MTQVWIDGEACTGCGACISECPAGAITLVAERAQVDLDLCRGCEICLESCPEGALRRIIEVDVVEEPELALAQRPTGRLTRREPAPLSETVTTVAAAALAGFALHVLRTGVETLTDWLLPSPPSPSSRSVDRGEGRGGRRQRRRQRGA
jgi:NAD-dependent dihydropyrimidine dehydrogenase PreA subunit